MIDRFFITFLVSLIACLITGIGIYIIYNYDNFGKKNIVYFMSFAAGVLITVSFLHIIPESFEMNTNAPIFLLIGFFSLHLLDKFLHAYVCGRIKCDEHRIGIIPMLGIAIHSFVDGIIYSVTFTFSILTGVLVTIGMILHEFPEGVITFLLLIRGKYKKKKAAIYSFLAAAVTTPFGMLVSYPFIYTLRGPLLGALLSLSAGALIYVGGTHLLSAVEKEKKKKTLIALALGILIAVGMIITHS